MSYKIVENLLLPEYFLFFCKCSFTEQNTKESFTRISGNLSKYASIEFEILNLFFLQKLYYSFLENKILMQELSDWE